MVINNFNCRYGQFDSAKETFEVIGDFESMLDLFICHLNPSAMRRLAQKLEEEGTDSELRRYCERILRVRSTGWTQGIFANFAAESMVPKGPEWGGGNWEIKTPTNLKDVPQWELAAEVTPYMRTDGGSIPSIVTDHIGVYLGLIKGRGNIVEVREDSLVKVLKPEGTETRANGLQTSAVTSTSNKTSGLPVGDSKVESLMGLETLTQSSGSTNVVDEQAKAEEEFKKSLYGTAGDGSSSDEDSNSKSRKLHIRIREKPVASATVDVDKIKEATKQFKLSEALGPPVRTKSLTGSQPDFSLLNPQAVPTNVGTPSVPSVSTPIDPFGTDSLTQAAPVSQSVPMLKGPGVAAGPIPEDFFQNTIPSLQVAASLPPPGTFLSRMDQNSQGLNSNKVPPNQSNASVADAGPSAGSLSQAAPHPTMSFGLPDGGVPPQSAGQPSGMQQAQVPQYMGQPSGMQLVQAQQHISSQPLDLSSLEGPGSSNSSKPAAPPSPKAVRPGQVIVLSLQCRLVLDPFKLPALISSSVILLSSQVPRGAAASFCFKTGLVHLEQNQLADALSCFDEGFLALAKDQSRGADIKAQATICAQYKVAVTLLQVLV